VALVLDAGALIAVDRNSRDVIALLETARRRHIEVKTSSGCVAQAWRSGGPRQALLARFLLGVTECPLDESESKMVGMLCASAKTSDVVDAHVALLVHDGDVVATSDVADISTLLHRQKKRAQLVEC
jgi:hypothetical protein